MSAGKTNFLMEYGTDFKVPITIRDKTSKTVIDLTGSTFSCLVTNKQGGTEVFEIVVENTALDNGQITLFYPLNSVNLVTLKEAWMTLSVTWSNGFTERLLEGNLVYSKGVKWVM